MPNQGIGLDQECFIAHVSSPAFQAGMQRGKWGCVDDEAIKWPNVLMWIACAPRVNSPDRFVFYFNLQQYPKAAPTACIWDVSTRTKLEANKRPKGVGNVQMAFRTDWQAGGALYVPWDRVAIEGHPDWKTDFQNIIWNPNHTIVHYLNMTYELLNSEQYTGV